MRFVLGTDGTGQDHLIVRAGGFRHPHPASAAHPGAGSVTPADAYLAMNGPEVFAFTLREVPRVVQSALDQAAWTIDDVDAVVMHQANEFMLKHLAQRLKIPLEKLVIALQDFGNTSSASIPLGRG